MHAIVPKSGRRSQTGLLFGSARYRFRSLEATRDLVRQAGVPHARAEDFMRTITQEFPYPTDDELFEEQIGSPMLAMALGERRKELSHYRAGKPDLYSAKACYDSL